MFTSAEFLRSATRASEFPETGLPEIAFLGRSNVGKSTLLNALVGRKVAFTSNTPGRTQMLNFFRVDEQLVLVDLPGYGYAKAPKSISGSWQAFIDEYLLQRESLALCVLLLDARRGWMASDLQLKKWLEFHLRPHVVVATKVDKLNQKESNQSRKAIRDQYPDGELIWFSGLSGQGVKEIWQTISKRTAR